MANFEILLSLVAFCVLLAIVAQRLDLPVAIPLVLGGMGLALIPGLPAVELDPELALALFLPPLLQVSAYRTDWPAFRSNLRPILLLAIGAVLFTTAAVAVVAHWLVPGLPWWAAAALGAIVAPPDAVAASSVLKKFNLPKRIVTVLEGESLINDASSLVLYRFAVAAVAASSVSYSSGMFQFFGMGIGGIIIGWLTGRLAMWVFSKVDDTMLDITISILAGFAAYLSAEALHASGVLGAVVCGLVLGRKQHAEFTARTRLELHAVWNFIEFLLASLIFMLIGLQMRGIVERLASESATALTSLALLALAVSVTLIVSRFIWVFMTGWLPGAFSRSKAAQSTRPLWTHHAVVSWAGMRGVVSLAAALALPANFPARDVIVFLAFCAIFATLIVQGTTLGWLVRKLEVIEPEKEAAEPAEALARAEIADAALEVVKEHLEPDASPEHSTAASALVDEYEARAERAADEKEAESPENAEQFNAQRRLRLVAIEAAREKLSEHTDQVDVETHRSLANELDLEEQQIRSAMSKSS
jgi:CPA1 family monovalent cation:H+ antiporter